MIATLIADQHHRPPSRCPNVPARRCLQIEVQRADFLTTMFWGGEPVLVNFNDEGGNEVQMMSYPVRGGLGYTPNPDGKSIDVRFHLNSFSSFVQQAGRNLAAGAFLALTARPGVCRGGEDEVDAGYAFG